MNRLIPLLAPLAQHVPPWLTPYQQLIERTVLPASPACLADLLNDTLRPETVTFVRQSSLPGGEPYECWIARTRTVPTRDNLHDYFNGLTWLRWPQAKRRLIELQADEIARRGISGSRGPLRDALTLFDENAALLQAPATLVEALRRRDWRAFFLTHRAEWQRARLVLFGHALMEKLMQPRKAITAHVWVMDELTDQAVADSLRPERLVTTAFLPLPVLGTPGWWPPNEEAGFYDDAAVFRP